MNASFSPLSFSVFIFIIVAIIFLAFFFSTLLNQFFLFLSLRAQVEVEPPNLVSEVNRLGKWSSNRRRETNIKYSHLFMFLT